MLIAVLAALWVVAAAGADPGGTSASPPNDGGASPAYDGSLEYNGGAVQHNPTLYAIYWLPSGDHSCANSACHYEPGIIDGDFGNSSTGYLGYAGLMDRYLRDVGSTGAASVVSQYYDTTSGFPRSIGTGYQFGGQWRDTSDYTHSGSGSDPLLSADIQGAVNRALAANPSWKDGVNSTFFVFTALGIESCLASACTPNVSSAPVHYCAYHDHFTDARGNTAVYANMPNVETWIAPGFFSGEGCHQTNALPNGDIYADNEFSTLSHELFEAATDPTLSGGWRDSTSGLEIGDPCSDHFGYSPYFGPSNTSVNGHLYNVQEEGNNADGDCSHGVSQPGDGSYYLLAGPYTATAGSSTGNIDLALTVLAPNRGCCGTDDPSITWGDGTSSEPGGDSGCTICILTGSHTYAFDPSASYPKTYTVTVTYWTGINACSVSCVFSTDTRRSISLHIVVFPPPDVVAPTAAPTQSPAANGAGWNNTDVTVSWNWSDNAGGSGIDSANCTTTSTSSGEGSSIVVTATCKDRAGNTGGASYTVKVDQTKPALTVSGNVTVNATSPAGATFTYTAAAATDVGGSGVVTASVGCSPTSGTVFAIGTTTVNCSATDVAGNTQTGSFTVHVRSAAEQLSILGAQVTGVGPGSSLAEKVKQIQAYVAANDKVNACSNLNAFISEAKAQSGKKLTPPQATSFVAQAKNIAATLGC